MYTSSSSSLEPSPALHHLAATALVTTPATRARREGLKPRSPRALARGFRKTHVYGPGPPRAGCSSLGGHPHPAIDGRLKSGQRGDRRRCLPGGFLARINVGPDSPARTRVAPCSRLQGRRKPPSFRELRRLALAATPRGAEWKRPGEQKGNGSTRRGSDHQVPLAGFWVSAYGRIAGVHRG